MTTGTRDDVLLELALEGGDEVGDGVSLGVGFVALWLRRSEMKNLFVVLDEEMRGRVAGEILGVEDVLHLNGFPCPAGNARCIAAQHLVHAAANRAKT